MPYVKKVQQDYYMSLKVILCIKFRLSVVAMCACGTQVIRLGLGKKADVISHANSNSNKAKLT